MCSSEFTLNVRIPGWARSQPVPGDLCRYDDGLEPGWNLAVNGRPVPAQPVHGFALLKRRWQAGDVVTVEFDLHPRGVVAHSEVKANRDRFAIERGPLVYRAEGADSHGTVMDRVFPRPVRFELQERPGHRGLHRDPGRRPRV